MSASHKNDFLDILAASFYSTFRMVAVSVFGALFVTFKVIMSQL